MEFNPFVENPLTEALNKTEKCKWWLDFANEMLDTFGGAVPKPLEILGMVLEDYMDYEIPKSHFNIEQWEENRGRIERTLATHGLSYKFGGVVRLDQAPTPARILEQALRNRDLTAVDEEFQRFGDSVDVDPRGALTAACALLEALFKIYLHDENQPLPKEQTIKPLWSVVSKRLGLDRSRLEDDDLKRILSGMTSIVDGLGALRTHAGSAHGRGRGSYRPESRHARLAINSACALAIFVIETWDARKRQNEARS